MEQGLQIFNHERFGQVRVVMIDGEPWFVGKDVAAALGYSNPSKALIDHVDAEDKLNNETLSSLGQRGGWLVNESGLYSLCLSSKLPDAKIFKRFVTSEVLPSVRKHGAYMTPETVEKVLSDPDTIIRLATQLKEEREAKARLEARNAILEPKALFADSVAASDSDILIGELAKILRQNGIQIGQNRLFRLLREKGYLCKAKGLSYNLPTQRSMEMQLFRIAENAVSKPDGTVLVTRTPRVTGRGQQYFVQAFLSGKIAA